MDTQIFTSEKAWKDLYFELNWLDRVLKRRKLIFRKKSLESKIPEVDHVEMSESGNYAKLVSRYELNRSERILLILALAQHIEPSVLDIFKTDNLLPPTSFGGVIGKNRAFIPTGETFIFIIAGNNMAKRLELLKIFDKNQVLFKENLLSLEEPASGESELSGILKPTSELLDLVLHGAIRKPDLSPSFPAKLITTEMDWDDLVLPSYSIEQLSEMESWIRYAQELSEDKQIGNKIKPGYKALFYGPPGTGKTLAATLIGKKTNRDVYRIDLSTVVSKYIGETEKNLKNLFDRAEHKDWILFFDEADALFGKRTSVSDAHDRYANQEVSYLLQRLEYFDGLVILATNMKNNIDKAFMRRFQNIVHFPVPKAEERLELWKKTIPKNIQLDNSVDLEQLATDHELTGAHILNVLSYCALKVLSNGKKAIDNALIRKGISREMAKEGKTI